MSCHLRRFGECCKMLLDRVVPRDGLVLADSAHAAPTPVSASLSTAATTSWGWIDVRQGWPGRGQILARVSRHASSWSPRTTEGTPYGAQLAEGTTGANSETTGVCTGPPNGPARCSGRSRPEHHRGPMPGAEGQADRTGPAPGHQIRSRPRLPPLPSR